MYTLVVDRNMRMMTNIKIAQGNYKSYIQNFYILQGKDTTMISNSFEKKPTKKSHIW